MKPLLRTASLALLLTTGIFITKETKACAKTETIEQYTPCSDSLNIELLNGQRNRSHHLFTSLTAKGIIFTNSLASSPLELYIFDLDSTLIHHTILNPKEKKTVTVLQKGVFMYDLFYKDESIERGKITVK